MIPIKENFDGSGQLLPPGWERAHDSRSNRYFYVDHNTKTTTWLSPISRWAKPIDECRGDELPPGWERITDPVIGVYYVDHFNRRNQWDNPVSCWRANNSNQNFYSNSPPILSAKNPGNSLDSNPQTISPATTSKPESSFRTSDIKKSATSLNNSNTLSTEIIDSIPSNNSTRGSRHDASLLDIMENRFGRKSSQSVEV